MAVPPQLIAAGIQIGGGLLAKELVGGAPQLDLAQIVGAEASRRRGETITGMDAQTDRFMGEAAAAGVTAGAALAGTNEAVRRQNQDALADLDASVADIVSQAIRQEQLQNFQNQYDRWNSQSQGLADILTVGGSALAGVPQLGGAGVPAGA